MASRLQDTVQRGIRASQPLASTVAPGTLYSVVDENVVERSNGTIWESFMSSPFLPPSLAAATLFGRGNTVAGPAEQITLSNSLIMTGSTLSVRTGIFNYTFNNSIVEPPSAGQVRLNVVYPWTAVSKMWMRFVSADDQDLFWGIMIIPIGATLLLQDKDDHDRYGRFVTTGVPIDKGLYAEIPITKVDQGTAINTGQQVFLRTSGG